MATKNYRIKIPAVLFLAALCSAGSAQTSANQTENNPTYSTAIYMHQDPHAFLEEAEAKMTASPGTPREVALAAKAALEAGENVKAQAYAVQALALADSLAAGRASRGFKIPRRYGGVPVADYYANFVLGRLAILKVDAPAAEAYLLASGRAASGDGFLNSYGPNLSLAVEILKSGDEQSRQSVLKFLDEIRVFWKASPSHFDQWAADINAGKMPNFQAAGTSLYY